MLRQEMAPSLIRQLTGEKLTGCPQAVRNMRFPVAIGREFGRFCVPFSSSPFCRILVRTAALIICPAFRPVQNFQGKRETMLLAGLMRYFQSRSPLCMYVRVRYGGCWRVQHQDGATYHSSCTLPPLCSASTWHEPSSSFFLLSEAWRG